MTVTRTPAITSFNVKDFGAKGDGADGWWVIEERGTWAREA